MLKLMKYEFRKMRTPLFIILLILVALQIAFMVSNHTKDDAAAYTSLILITLLAFALYCYILVAGIVSYSRELNNRTGYMVFMTPVRPMSIVLSKLLFTLIAAVVATALFATAAFLDTQQLIGQRGVDETVWTQLNYILQIAAQDANISITKLLLTMGAMIISVFTEILLVMCIAYLSITLSATALQNRRGFLRGLLSFLLFVALFRGTGWVSDQLFVYETFETFAEVVSYSIWPTLYTFALAGLFAWISAVLLKRKVSL